MRIVLTKGSRQDHIALRREDGSQTAFDFPKKGLVPHDAFHFFVESELAMRRGFWGLVAGGMDPGAVGALAAAGGHASASRAGTPAAGIVELLQAERLVESFEAESWSGGQSDAGIMAMAEPGWAASQVPPPAGVPERLGAIRERIADFSKDWKAAAVGEAMVLEWKDTDFG